MYVCIHSHYICNICVHSRARSQRLRVHRRLELVLPRGPAGENMNSNNKNNNINNLERQDTSNNSDND